MKRPLALYVPFVLAAPPAAAGTDAIVAVWRPGSSAVRVRTTLE